MAAAAWFNKFAFTPNGPGQPGGIGPGGADGNTPRAFLIAPGYRDVDMSLERDFRIKEAIGFQFRADFTNIFNLVSLNNPSGTSGPPQVVGGTPKSSSFGRITAASSPRVMQIGARFTF